MNNEPKWQFWHWASLGIMVAVFCYFLPTWEVRIVMVVQSTTITLLCFWIGDKPKAWYAQNGWLASAGVAMTTFVCSFSWWVVEDSSALGWLAVIALIVAIICFLRHKCLSPQHDWCNRFNRWWHTTGWPALKTAFGVSMTATKAGGASTWTWMSGPGLSGLNSALPVVKEMLEFSLKKLLGPALIIYAAYRVYEPRWIGWGWWLLILWTLLTVLWKPFRDMEGKVFAAVAKACWKQLVDTWQGAHGAAKVVWTLIAVPSVIWIGYLLHTYWDRHSSLFGFWRFLVRNEYTYTTCGILLGLVIAFFLINKEYTTPGEKKPTKDEGKAAKKIEADLIKMIRKHRGEEGVAAYKKDKKAGKKFSW